MLRGSIGVLGTSARSAGAPMLRSCAPDLRTQQPFGGVPSASILKAWSTKKWKQLGSLRPAHPDARWKAYGGKPLEGVVVRAKTDKTVMVEAYAWRRHPTYKVLFKQTTRVMTHDENNICHVGDRVLVVPSRAHSRQKRHELKKIIKKEPGIAFLAQNPEHYVDYSLMVMRKSHEDEMRKVVIMKPEEARERMRIAAQTAEKLAEAMPTVPKRSKGQGANRVVTKNKMKKTIEKFANKASKRRNVKHKVESLPFKKPKLFAWSLTDAASQATQAL